jgi:hypothetical protein
MSRVKQLEDTPLVLYVETGEMSSEKGNQSEEGDWKITRTRTPVQVICEHLLVALSRNQMLSLLTPMVIKKVLREDKLQKMIINTAR